MTTDYEQDAQNFLKLTGTTFSYRMLTPKCPKWGAKLVSDSPSVCKQCGQVHGHRYRITLKRGDKRFATDYWDSYANMEAGKQTLTAYDALACLYYMWDASFEEFCSTYGYSADSISVRDMRRAQKRDNRKLAAMYSPDELAQLNEIA